MVQWMDPFSCLLFSPCSALSDLELLVLSYLLCSENLALKKVYLSDLVCMLSPKFDMSVCEIHCLGTCV